MRRCTSRADFPNFQSHFPPVFLLLFFLFSFLRIFPRCYHQPSGGISSISFEFQELFLISCIFFLKQCIHCSVLTEATPSLVSLRMRVAEGFSDTLYPPSLRCTLPPSGVASARWIGARCPRVSCLVSSFCAGCPPAARELRMHGSGGGQGAQGTQGGDCLGVLSPSALGLIWALRKEPIELQPGGGSRAANVQEIEWKRGACSSQPTPLFPARALPSVRPGVPGLSAVQMHRSLLCRGGSHGLTYRRAVNAPVCSLTRAPPPKQLVSRETPWASARATGQGLGVPGC